MRERNDLCRRVTGLGVLALTVWTLGGLPATASEAPPVVHRAIEYHGGSVFDRSTTELELCSGSGCYEISARMNDGVYRYEVAGPVSAGHRRVEASNDAVRHWHEGVEQEVTPANAQRLRDWAMARIYFVFLPYRLGDPGVQLADLGLEGWGDRQLRRVKVTFRSGSSTDAEDEFLYWFDPQTSRLEQFAYSFEGDPGGLRFRRLFNYRRVGGLLFFHQENLGVDADGLDIEQVTPEFVERRMRSISTVTVDDIQVEPIAD